MRVEKGVSNGRAILEAREEVTVEERGNERRSGFKKVLREGDGGKECVGWARSVKDDGEEV